MKICVIGAAGTGTSTIGRHIAFHYDIKQIESDYYAWEQTNPPFQKDRSYEEGRSLLNKAFDENENLIICGNVARWGKEFSDRFDLLVFLKAPTETRIKRINYRERELYGERVLDGGDMFENFKKFLWYAEHYDVGDETFRSLKQHTNYIKNHIKCPVLEIDTYGNIDIILENLFSGIDKLILKKDEN
ncbi:MAG: AAA family ATPase [Clostridia bacterium]|nr:AAA family ATPase [Clostridia bacterium]